VTRISCMLRSCMLTLRPRSTFLHLHIYEVPFLRPPPSRIYRHQHRDLWSLVNCCNFPRYSVLLSPIPTTAANILNNHRHHGHVSGIIASDVAPLSSPLRKTSTRHLCKSLHSRSKFPFLKMMKSYGEEKKVAI
jgi:hypothetical protein